MQSRDRSIIEHIKKYCVEIQDEISEIDNDKEKYDKSTVYNNSLALCVLQIGELVGLLTDEYKEINKRNVVAHKYGSFDYEVLWETVTENIPELLIFCNEELDNE